MNTSLYRPVNKVELDLIADLDWNAFPPRLPEQPIFYPVMNQEYASQITVEWNLNSYKNGFVTKFDVDSDYLKKYKVEKVGLDHFLELWVPSEDLEEFNSNIKGKIEVVEAYSSIPNAEYVFIENIFKISQKEINISFRYYSESFEIQLNNESTLGGVPIKTDFKLVRRVLENDKPVLNYRVVTLKDKSDSDKLKEGYFYLIK